LKGCSEILDGETRKTRKREKKKSISAKPGKIMPHLPSKENMDPALTN